MESNQLNNQIHLELEKNRESKHQSTLFSKVITIGGSLIASLFFIIFAALCFISGSNPALLTMGIIISITSLMISSKPQSLGVATVNVCLFCIAVICIGFGMKNLKINETYLSLIIIAINFISFLISKNHFIKYINVILGIGSLFSLIFFLFEDVIKVYEEQYIYSIISILSIAFYLTSINQAWFYAKSKLSLNSYQSVIYGILTSLILTCYYTSFESVTNTNWITSSTVLLLISHFIWKQTENLLIKDRLLLLFLCLCCLGCTFIFPAIGIALLILIIGFKHNNTSIFSIGLTSLIVMISKFYYDLNFTLLVKSALLMSSGILFLITYYIFKNKYNENL